MGFKFGSGLLAAAMLFTAASTAFAAPPAAAQDGSSSMRAAAPSSGVAPSSRQEDSSLEVAITYDATLSNLVSSSRFTLQGGSIQIHGRFYRGWGVVADIAGAHAASINSSGVGLDMVTATFGPRYTWSPAHRKLELFGQGLAGEAWGFNSVFPNAAGATPDANSLAVEAGGGMNFRLSPRLALRAFEANYLRTQMPNSTNNLQNNLRLGAGIVFRLP
jgi:hypothetical protein